MLSGEGNENGEKTIVGLISKKPTLYVQHKMFILFFQQKMYPFFLSL